MIELVVVLAVLVLVDAAVLRFGVDSRDGDDWASHRHNHPGGARRFPG